MKSLRILHLEAEPLGTELIRTNLIDELDDVLSLVAGGSLDVEVEGSIPLEEGEEIHRRMEDGRSEGRLVMEVAGDR